MKTSVMSLFDEFTLFYICHIYSVSRVCLILGKLIFNVQPRNYSRSDVSIILYTWHILIIIFFSFFRKKFGSRTGKQQMETERKTKFNIHERQLLLLFLPADLPLMFFSRCTRAHMNKKKLFFKAQIPSPLHETASSRRLGAATQHRSLSFYGGV